MSRYSIIIKIVCGKCSNSFLSHCKSHKHSKNHRLRGCSVYKTSVDRPVVQVLLKIARIPQRMTGSSFLARVINSATMTMETSSGKEE